MFQIAAIGLAGTILSLAVRSYRPERAASYFL